MGGIAIMLAVPGAILLLLVLMPFFIIWDWYYYGLPPFAKRSISDQYYLNLRSGKLTPHEHVVRFFKRR